MTEPRTKARTVHEALRESAIVHLYRKEQVTVEALAALFNVTWGVVRRVLARNGIPLRKEKTVAQQQAWARSCRLIAKRRTKSERNALIRERCLQGRTYAEVGAEFGISKQRVCEILTRGAQS